jgi:hypothetical protein
VADQRGSRLLHRKQDWVFGVGKDRRALGIAARMALQSNDTSELKDYPGLCRHISREDLYSHLVLLSDREGSELQRCDKCALEYQVDVVDVDIEDTSGLAFVFTAWRDLGRCLSPFDPRWTAHFSDYEETEYKRSFGHLHDSTEPNKGWREDEEPVNDWALGGIRETFEGDADFKLVVEDCFVNKAGLKALTDVSADRL